MRPALLLSALALCGVGAFAQTDAPKKSSQVIATMDGASVKSLVGNISDDNVYDQEGNVLDSIAATQLLHTYNYRRTVARVKGQTGLKKAIVKIDPIMEATMMDMSLRRNAPISPKLQIGEILDLAPFGNRIGADKLTGKAVVLIFWSDIPYPNPQKDGYADINYITGKFANPDKFQVFAITDLRYDEAADALIKRPIMNAKHIFESKPINKAFRTDNRPLIVITDKDHKITYAATNWLATTDRFLYKSLEAL